MTSPEAGLVASSRGILALEVTARCNRKCLYCYNEWREGALLERQELTAPEWTALANRVIQESGRTSIQISGGEPLLRTDLFEIIEGLRAPGRRIALVTDGGLLNDNVVKELVWLGVGPVQPTLLSAQRDLHDELKGAPSFDATIGAISRLLSARVPVSVSFVCTKKNYMHFAEVLELCFALGVKTVAWSRFCTAGSGVKRHEELAPTAEMVSSCLDAAVWAKENLGMKVAVAISLPHCLPTKSQSEDLQLGRCALGTPLPGYTIDPWGRLRACSVSPEVLGDLRRESWSEVLRRAQADYFPQVKRPPRECLSCKLVQSCGGGCRESARAAFGSFDRADPLAPLPCA